MKTEKIEFTEEEAQLLDNILVEHCMSLVEFVGSQKTQEDFEKSIQILQSSVFAKQTFFKESFNKTFDFVEPIYLMFRTLAESAIEGLKEIKESLLKNGDLNTGQIVDKIVILEQIIKKIPEKSLIVF